MQVETELCMCEFSELNEGTGLHPYFRSCSVRVQIAEVTDVMRDNVGRLLERGDQLDHLQDRSEGLATTSDQFRTSAGRLRRQAWWENMRGRLCIAAVALLLFLLIFSKCNGQQRAHE